MQAELAIARVGANGAQGLQAAAGTVTATFALVFVAEWGDKSFFSTIGMWALHMRDLWSERQLVLLLEQFHVFM